MPVPVMPFAALVTLFAVALLWWWLHWIAVDRCDLVLCELERWTLCKRRAPLKGDVSLLLVALGDAMSVRNRKAARILRTSRRATVARATVLVDAAREAVVTKQAAELLGRAAPILEAATRIEATESEGRSESLR